MAIDVTSSRTCVAVAANDVAVTVVVEAANVSVECNDQHVAVEADENIIEVVTGGPMGPPGGATGATGPTGPRGYPGQIRYTGHGPPPVVIIGACPHDTYLDLGTGNIYRLE
jgi:hypothetical protein